MNLKFPPDSVPLGNTASRTKVRSKTIRSGGAGVSAPALLGSTGMMALSWVDRLQRTDSWQGACQRGIEA
jgi:hypothetical protein